MISNKLKELFYKIKESPLADKTYLVGGSIRDNILGLDSYDWDFAVEQSNGAKELTFFLSSRFPEEFSKPHQLGACYPIWEIQWKSFKLQFSDTHSESYPDPNSRQRHLVFAPLAEDCQRRDFTINMLYQRVSDEKLLDPSNCGLEDIQNKILRIHPKAQAIHILKEDPLRIIRLLRFASRFSMTIQSELQVAALNLMDRLNIVSPERIRDELIKVIDKHHLDSFLELSRTTNILGKLFPELLPMIGCTQDKTYHSEGDVWKHTLMVISNSAEDLELQLAALLHDTGKPFTRTVSGERIKFLGHEIVSTEIATKFLTRLKFPKHTVEAVTLIVKLHLRGSDSHQWKGLRAARKFLRDADPYTEKLLKLIEADSKASLAEDGKPRLNHIKVLKTKLKEAAEIPIQKKAILSGHEIMDFAEIKASPQIGQIQKHLLELSDEFADQGKVLSKEDAFAWLKQWKRL